MKYQRNPNAGTLDRIGSRAAAIHVRIAWRSFDIPLIGLDLSAASDDFEVKHAIANHLEVSDRRLDDYVIDRHADGNLTLRRASFGEEYAM